MTRTPNTPVGALVTMLTRAAFGVAAEQRALRAAQHFDPLDVEQRGVEALLAAEIDAVDIDADALVARGLVGVERHDAADADGQRRLARFEGRDAQARDRAVGEIEQALGRGGRSSAWRVGDADRDRRLLEVGFALGRGDDDRAEALVLRRLGAVLDTVAPLAGCATSSAWGAGGCGDGCAGALDVVASF